jgi:hypothetical protein
VRIRVRITRDIKPGICLACVRDTMKEEVKRCPFSR